MFDKFQKIETYSSHFRRTIKIKNQITLMIPIYDIYCKTLFFIK